MFRRTRLTGDVKSNKAAAASASTHACDAVSKPRGQHCRGEERRRRAPTGRFAAAATPQRRDECAQSDDGLCAARGGFVATASASKIELGAPPRPSFVSRPDPPDA